MVGCLSCALGGRLGKNGAAVQFIYRSICSVYLLFVDDSLEPRRSGWPHSMILLNESEVA